MILSCILAHDKKHIHFIDRYLRGECSPSTSAKLLKLTLGFLLDALS